MAEATRAPLALVVDDTEGNRYATSRMLRGAGFDVREAETGREALRLVRDLPDIVVLDVNLPDISGFDVARKIRADRVTALIPILHLSASYVSDLARAEGLDSGANYYLTHPVDPVVFIAAVRALMRMRRIEEDLNASSREWQATFDGISDAVFVLETTGTILRANRAAERLLGRSADVLSGVNWVETVLSSLGPADERLLREAVEQRQAVVHELRTGTRWLRIAVDPIVHGSPNRGSVVCIVTDITDRKRADEERARLLETTQLARTDAEAANRAKSDFLATMSHEIRTPINAIMGYAQILDMGIPGSVSDEQRLHLDRLRRSASHLLGLVNEILDLAKVESGRMQVDREHATIDEAVEAALALTRPLAAAKGLSIVDQCAARHTISYLGDAGRVRQIILNLLSNAVKFTEPGGTIVVDCELVEASDIPSLGSGGPWLAVHVRDTGIGIAPVNLNHIFEPFVQEKSGPTREHGGTGLGLTISRRLARLMGGELSVRSTLGKGSAFTLWLPATADVSSSPTEEMPVPTAAASAYDPRMLMLVGTTLKAMMNELLTNFTIHLRADSSLPALGGVSDTQLIDHYPPYLADLAQSLVIVAEMDGDGSALLRDGNAIRTVISERHGVQRFQLGFSGAQLEREYAVFREELERLLRSRMGASAEVDAALTLVGRLLEQSRAASVRAHRQAIEEQR